MFKLTKIFFKIKKFSQNIVNYFDLFDIFNKVVRVVIDD